MTFRRQTSFFLLSCATLVGSGCTVGSKPNLPTIALPEHWEAPTTVSTGEPSGDWWNSFGDEALNRLVRRVLESNSQLLASTRRLEKAQMDAELASKKQRLGLSLSAALGWDAVISLLRRIPSRDDSLRGTMSFDFDVGGGLASHRNAAFWFAEASKAEREQLRLTIVADSLKQYWQLGLSNERLVFAQKRMAYLERTLALVRARYASGDAAKSDIVEAQQKLIGEHSAMDRLGVQMTTTRHALAVLLGGPPEANIDIPEQLPRSPLPTLSAGIPAQVIRHRPDVLAAESVLRALLADVDAARADLYPNLTLTSSVGTSSASLQRFLANPLTSVGVALALPFVEWNSTQIKIRGKQAEFEATEIEFKRKVFEALKDVEDHLTTGAELERHAAQLQEHLETLRVAEAMAERRYVAGATSVQPWLNSQQALQDSEDAILLNQHDRLTNRAELLVALGGVSGGTTTMTEAGNRSAALDHAPST